MTMLSRLPPWSQKLIAWLLLAVLMAAGIALFNAFYLSPLTGFVAERERETAKRQRVERILRQESAVRQQMAEFRRRTSEQLFLASNKASAASSELQNLVKRLIESQTRSSILSLKPYPVEGHEGYNEVTIEVRVRGLGHEGLKRVLYGMESSRPLLQIRKLDIKRPSVNYSSVHTGEADNQLGAVFVISAFFRPDPATAGAAS